MVVILFDKIDNNYLTNYKITSRLNNTLVLSYSIDICNEYKDILNIIVIENKFNNYIINILYYIINTDINDFLIINPNLSIFINVIEIFKSKNYFGFNIISKNADCIYFKGKSVLHNVIKDYKINNNITTSILNNNYGYILENFETEFIENDISYFNGIPYIDVNNKLLSIYSLYYTNIDYTEYLLSIEDGGKYNTVCYFIENGFIYEKNEIVKRVIPKNHILEFINSELYSILVKENKLIKMIKNTEKKVFNILEIIKIKNVSRPTEWATLDYINGYKFLIDIMLYTLNLGYYLKDPHIWNITLYKGKFIYLDYGDFTISKDQHMLDNFFNFFISDTVFTDRIININFIMSKINSLDNINITDYDKLIEFKKILDLIEFDGENKWDSYTKIEIPNSLLDYNKSIYNNKSEVIFKYLDKLNYDSFLDIGCSTGFYTFYTAYMNKPSVGIDISQKCIVEANSHASKKDLDAVFLYYDIMNPPNAYGINGGYQNSSDRLKSDFVLVSAVTHHLFHNNYSVYKQVSIFNEYTNNILLLEYIPITDNHVGAFNKTKWVDINELIIILKNYFSVVFIEDSYPDGRQWLICIKDIKKANLDLNDNS
jgi:SAM-dependent methyltransferase